TPGLSSRGPSRSCDVRCDDCPLPAGTPCRGEALRHCCDRPAYRELFRRLAAGDPSLPPATTMAASFARAVARHALGGCRKVSDGERERRLAICRACPLLREDGRCGACGCGVRAKAAWLSERCPEGRWGEPT